MTPAEALALAAWPARQRLGHCMGVHEGMANPRAEKSTTGHNGTTLAQALRFIPNATCGVGKPEETRVSSTVFMSHGP